MNSTTAITTPQVDHFALFPATGWSGRLGHSGWSELLAAGSSSAGLCDIPRPFLALASILIPEDILRKHPMSAPQQAALDLGSSLWYDMLHIALRILH